MCSISCSLSEIYKEEGPFGHGCNIPDILISLGPAYSDAIADLVKKINIECQVDSQVVWKPIKANCFGTCEGLSLEKTQLTWAKLAFGGGWDVQVVYV